MRIRRRAVGAPPPTQASSSPSSPQNRFPPAPPAPSPAPAPASVTAAARPVEPLEREVDRTTPEAARFDNGRPSGAGNLQEEETEERDEGSGKEKKMSAGGEEDGRSGYERGQRGVDVVCSKPVVPKREEKEGPVEVEAEKKSEDSRPIDEKTAAAALCKKGDGKGWHCKRAAQCGYSLCQYHLDKLRSYYSHSQTKKKKKKKQKMMKPKPAPSPEKSTAAGVAQRQQKQKKSSSGVEDQQYHAMSTGPGVSDSFYYYSGFGPPWGKRRRCRSGDAAKAHDGGAAQAAQPSPHTAAAAPASGAEEEGELECDSRGRDGQQRPWKSRALSSLL